MITVQPKYAVRFIRQGEVDYVYLCWHASRAYCTNRHERLCYVARHFVRKYPEYEGRAGGVYKDICGILE